MGYTFEHLEIKHQEEVISILNYYIRETITAYRENEVDNEHFLNFMNTDEIYCGFAVKNEQDTVIGFCTLEPYMPISTFSETAEPIYFIHHEHTGKGVGTIILKKLEEESRKRGISKLLVDIASENVGSIKFHEKHGFTECGRLHNIGKKFGRYFSVVLMEKSI